jgi:hypothetical protein
VLVLLQLSAGVPPGHCLSQRLCFPEGWPARQGSAAPTCNTDVLCLLCWCCCSSQQEFPLAIVSFNVTTWALAALRAGRLDKAAQQLGGHLAAANRLHCGAMYEFYSRCGHVHSATCLLAAAWLAEALCTRGQWLSSWATVCH